MVDASEESRDRAIREVFYPAERIPFVHRQGFSGARSTVALVSIATVLAFVTGLSNLSRGAVTFQGPLATILPITGDIIGLAGVVSAFVLGIVTFGLRRRRRLAWRAAMLVLPVLVLLPLTTLQPTDVPLLLVILVTYPSLVWNRSGFDQSIDLSPLQIASLLSILGVVTYGTVGSYTLQDQFTAIGSWTDALYYVIITIATVGYGDVTPTTTVAKHFSLSIVLLGTGAFTVAVGSLIVPAIESRMASAFGNMTASELTLLEDHVVVLGYGDVTESLLEEIGDETEVVVVTPDEEAASALDDEGVNVLTGDPADESVLEDAQIGAARGVVVGGPDDARDVLAVLAARNLDPDIRIVAAANESKHVDKLEAVGADDVIDPRSIGGRLLGRSVLAEDSSSAADPLEPLLE